jgi:TP901 family phage tail tape measure protein
MSADNFIVQVKVIPKAQEFQQDLQNIADKIVANVNVKISGQQGVKDLNKDLKGLDKNAKQATDSAKNLGNSLNQVDKESKSLGQSFGDIVTKVGKFYLATKPIQMMQQAFDEALQSVKDFDDAMTDLRKVSDLDGEALTDYTIKLGELGEAVYRSRTEMTEAAVLFKQTGASDEDAAKLAQLANLYMNVADNEMTAADASAYITSQMKAFKITADDAITILDKTNEVSNQFAVSSSDISRALTTSSSSLAVYGNDINETMALVTAGAEIMTGKSQQVGRGLRSIGANISALASSAGELKFQVNGATETISLIDEETGDMVNTFQALSEIHKYWDKMTASEKAALATTLAGKTQLDVFSSVLSNFNTAIEANTVAVESNGSAWEENNKRADSISAKLNLLKSQFQELVLGKGGLQEFAKILLDLSINTLKLVNDLGGLKTIITALIGLAVVNKADAIVSLFKNLPLLITSTTTSMKGYLTAVYATITGNKELTAALELEGIAINGAKLAFGSLFAVLTAGIAIYSRLKQEQEQATQNAIDSANSFKSYSDTLGNTLSKIQSESTTKSQLLEINKSLNDSYDNESEKLKDINDLRAENVELLHQEAVAKAEQTQHEIGAEATKQRRYLQSSNIGQESDYERVEGLTGTPEERLKKATGSLKEFEANQENLSNAELRRYSALSSYYNKLSADVENAKNVVETYDEAQKIANSSTDEWSKTVQENSAELENQGSQVQFTDEEIQQYADDMGISFEEAKDQLKSFNGGIDDTATDIDTLAKSIGVSVDELQNFADTMGLSIDSAAEILPRFNEWNEAVDDIQSSYEVLTQAVEEYNEQGGYTTDTLQQLLALDPAYLAALQEENGQLTINTQMLMTKVQAQAEEAKQIIYNTAIEKLNAVASGEAGNATETAGQQHNNAVAGIDAETGSLNENTKAKLANAVAEARGRGGGASEGEINKILSEMTNQLKAVDNWANTTAKNFSKGMGKAAKATNKATKAVKEQKSATETLKDKYKTVIDFIIKQYDKQIDKIKEAKDAAIKSVESQIKALEKEKDSKVKAIDAEITALQRERDAREKYWQDQLDKLEKENDERERNIALQEKQQALALAQQTNVMVLKDGQFQYTQDESAVAGAEQDLAQQEDQNEYERQKELIEELRDTELEWYDERIQSLEDYKDQVEEYYENQIEQLEEYKEYLEEYYEAQIEALKAEKDAVNETLEEGVANQQEYWDKMKEQLQSFVEEWNALVGEMTFPNISGSGISLSAVGGKISASMNGKSTGDNKVSAYASGKGSIGDSEIAVVGENPKYRELVIGSKLNNDQGVVMNLKRGSGVVNAGTTNTLASIFNSLNGQKSVGQPVSNSNQSMSIQIGSINLPEVKDGQGFIDYLQNFSADITQQSFRRA